MNRSVWALVPLLSLLLTACGSAGQTAARPTAGPAANSASLEVAVASTDLAVGKQRFTFGIIDADHPLSTRRVSVTLYHLQGATAAVTATLVAQFSDFARGLQKTDANSAAIALKGVYVCYPTFSRTGRWGIEVRVRHHGRVVVTRSAPFQVRAHTAAPAVGSPAPRSQNPTVAQVPVSRLDSGRPPDDMHRLSIAAAIAEHRPLVVLFATASFCTSRLCGPEIEVVQRLERRFRQQVNFIHIEVYRDANPANGLAPAMKQWHLTTEPWVFVVDRRGIVRARFEGPTPGVEITRAIRAAIAT